MLTNHKKETRELWQNVPKKRILVACNSWADLTRGPFVVQLFRLPFRCPAASAGGLCALWSSTRAINPDSKECDHDEVFMNWSTYNLNASSLTANSPLWVLGHHGDNICLDRTGQSEVCFHFNRSSQKNKQHLLNFSAGPPWMLL